MALAAAVLACTARLPAPMSFHYTGLSSLLTRCDDAVVCTVEYMDQPTFGLYEAVKMNVQHSFSGATHPGQQLLASVRYLPLQFVSSTPTALNRDGSATQEMTGDDALLWEVYTDAPRQQPRRVLAFMKKGGMTFTSEPGARFDWSTIKWSSLPVELAVIPLSEETTTTLRDSATSRSQIVQLLRAEKDVLSRRSQQK